MITLVKIVLVVLVLGMVVWGVLKAVEKFLPIYSMQPDPDSGAPPLPEGGSAPDESDRFADLRRALNELPAWKGGPAGFLRRGTDLPEVMAADIRVGAIFQDPAFFSTSYDHARAYPGKYQFFITPKEQGSRARVTADFFQTPEEKEVLYFDRTDFLITRVSENGDRIYVWMTEQ